MGVYLIRRFVDTIVVLFGVSLLTFTISFVMPGDPARTIAGPMVSEEAVQRMRKEWGLDQPVPVQYITYMSHLLRGDMGRSYLTSNEVLPSILMRLPATAELALAGELAILMIGIPVGIISAVKQHTAFDRVSMVLALLGICVPRFFLGLLFLYVFAFKLSFFPLGGYGGLRHVVLPALTLGLTVGAWYARVLRSSMLDIIHADYVRTARAKGLKESVVIIRHAFRNAAGPVVTMVGADVGTLLGGTLILEKVFGWPGIGLQAWQAIDYLDIPLLMGTVLVGAVFIVLGNLVADIARGIVDPRIRYS